MKFEIAKNEKYSSLEIMFDGKPAAAVRDLLKGRRFRWNGARGIWYGYGDAAELAEALEQAADGAGVTEQNSKTIDLQNSAAQVVPMKKEKPVPSELADVIRAEFSRVWGKDQKMIDFCCGEISRASALENDLVMIWKKQKIETSFCFGESGYDYDEAQQQAEHARSSEAYFKRENLKEYDAIIAALEGNGTGYYSNAQPYIRKESYIRAGDLRLCNVVFYRPADFYNMTESEKARIRLPYDSELETIREGYKEERAAMEKRLDSYLKRYGLSKVRAWTYWLDA